MSDDVFHLTPLDVRKQDFTKALRGYHPLEVEDFRSRVAGEMERLVRERNAFEERYRAAQEQLKAYREREKAMNEALVAAQQLRAETKEQAEREAAIIVRAAEALAETRLARAQREIEKLQDSAGNLSRQHHAYLAVLRSIVERQKAELEAFAANEVAPFGKVAGTIAPAGEGDAEQPREGRAKSSPRWIKSIVEE
jgi:DivIVA domain-containing protein